MDWRVDTPGEFYDCDEPTVVYFDPASGNTHLLSAFAGLVINQLACRTMNLAQLEAALSPYVESQDREEIAGALPGLLDELLQLDLVTAS